MELGKLSNESKNSKAENTNGKEESELVFEENIDHTEKEKYKLFIRIKSIIEDKLREGKNNYMNEKEDIIYINNSYLYHLKGKEYETFLENSRFIRFINNNINNIDDDNNQENNIFNNDNKIFDKKFFIHNQDSLDQALKKSKITDAILNNKENKQKDKDQNNSRNSSNSSKSINSLNIEDILNNSIIEIKQDKPIKLSPIFSEENLKKRFLVENIYDLDFNFKRYKKFITDRVLDEKYKNYKWFEEIIKYYKDYFKTEIYIIGGRGIGKTTNLLYSLKTMKIPRLYFPIKIMNEFNRRKWKKIILYESLYIFKDNNDMNEFKKSLSITSDAENLVEFIYDYLKIISKFYEGKKYKKRIIVILDECDDYEKNDNYIFNIINFVNNNRKQFLLCILGNCPYIYNKYYDYIKGNKIIDYNFIYWNLPFNTSMEITELPIYYFRYKDNLKNNKLDKSGIRLLIKKEIAERFKEISLKNFFVLSKYLDVEVSIDELFDDFKSLPIEYLNIETKNKIIKISFAYKLYKEVFTEKIKGILQVDNIKSNFNLAKISDKDKNPVEFEDIIVEQMWYNLLGLEHFPEKNKFKIKNIYSIKDYDDYINKDYISEKSSPIIIRQTQMNGKYYDLLIITNYNEERIGIFIQIGVNKSRSEINTYYNNLVKFNNDYIRGINYLVNEKIKELGFLLIFDYDKQILINENSISKGYKYCKSVNIAYLIYKNFHLFEDLNSENPITKIDAKKTLIFEEIISSGLDSFKDDYRESCKNLIKEKREPSIKLFEHEIKNAIEFINKKYNKKFNDYEFVTNMGENLKDFINFGFFSEDSDQLSFIVDGNEPQRKYISYNNEMFKIKKNNKIVKMNNSDKKSIGNMTWDLYLLNKKRKYSDDSK